MKSNKYISYLYTAVTAVFLSVLTTSIINYKVASPPPMDTPSAMSRTATETMRSQMAISLTDRNLFSIDKTVPVQQTTATGTGPGGGPAGNVSTSFNGKLTGVVIGENPVDSRAILALDNKDVYVLDTRREQDGYLLKSVTYDGAVFTLNGREYSLVLEGGTSTPASTAPARTPAVTTPPPASTTEPAASGGTDQLTIERGEILEQLKDINNVLRSMLVSPLYSDGEFVGYRVTRMNDDSPVKALGLQRGDIINRINGEELTNPNMLFEMLSKVDDINAVSVDITRGGEKKTLFVEIQ